MINGVAVHHPAIYGIQGWQWMYIAWGIPAVLMGIIVLTYLPDGPRMRIGWKLTRGMPLRTNQAARRSTTSGPPPYDSLDFASASQSAFISCGLLLRRINQLWRRILPAQHSGEVVRSAVEQVDLGGDHPSYWRIASDSFWSAGAPIALAASRLHGRVPITSARWRLLGVLFIPASLSFSVRLALAILLFTTALAGMKAYIPAFWALPSLLFIPRLQLQVVLV